MIFKGTATALITPFTRDGVDLESFGRILDDQLAGGVDAVVVLGTTGEPATMTAEEKKSVIEFAVKKLKGKLPVIVGTGANSTAAAVEMSVLAEKLGADALLLVTPYYNKATQQGLIEHFGAVAEAVKLPTICYNVPGRTGVNMAAGTTLRLAREYENIIAVKEASGNFEQATAIIKDMPENFIFLSGDDGITLPLMAIGGSGVISVVANVLPAEFSSMVHLALEEEYGEARTTHLRMADICKALFEEGNPAGIKAALVAKGVIACGRLRAPLAPVSDNLYARIASLLAK